MPTKLALLSTVVLLAGCAQMRQTELNNAMLQCNATIPRQVGNATKRANCFNEVSIRLANSPAEPLIRALRTQMAARVDRGEISIEDADVELSQKFFTINQELQRANAEIAANRGAALIGAATMMQALRPPPIQYNPAAIAPQQLRFAPVSCTTIGAITNCQ